MNEHVYTFIGCCHALEHALAGETEAAEAIGLLASIRESLLAGPQGGEAELHDALRNHVVSLLEAVEMLRANPKYRQLDDTLIQLMNHYYNISDAIMGGGGGASYGSSGSKTSKD